MKNKKYNYGTAILAAFEYLLENYKEVFIIGQGLWSPWYVGNTMTDLDKNFGKIYLFLFISSIILFLFSPPNGIK